MDEAKRRALEAEFDGKSAKLSGMMEQVDEVQRAYARLALALRARAVKEKENAAREETVEMERMLARCQQAKSDLDAAKSAGDAQRVAACEATCEAEKLSFELAQRHERDACRRYQDELRRQGFATEQAYRDAFLTLPAQKKLEEQVEPFRRRYAELLARLEEINAELEAEA